MTFSSSFVPSSNLSYSSYYVVVIHSDLALCLDPLCALAPILAPVPASILTLEQNCVVVDSYVVGSKNDEQNTPKMIINCFHYFHCSFSSFRLF